MDLGIAQRTAVVGGASSGLGRASTLRLAEAGCALLPWARQQEALPVTAEEARRAGSPRVETVTADASSNEAAAIVADAFVSHFGGADILVLNAGGPPPGDATLHDAPRCARPSDCWSRRPSTWARAGIPAARDGEPDEIGSVVAFLCSESAGYVNGAFVPVDGGMLRSLG